MLDSVSRISPKPQIYFDFDLVILKPKLIWTGSVAFSPVLEKKIPHSNFSRQKVSDGIFFDLIGLHSIFVVIFKLHLLKYQKY